ncbi:MAG TPA: GNAT family N-acetyltransferase [Planctomycetaceae bacterium]|nr:GNAT family N-acetyltransferase [Planctomycetaceae bacterium]
MFNITVADLNASDQAIVIVAMLDDYAKDIMGGGEALPALTKSNLIHALRQRNDCCVIVAWANDQPAGMAICFEGFSTFACKPTFNIHDLFVVASFRGRGLSRLLLEKAESIAAERGCCKLTLEVLEGNHAAQHVYKKFGFEGYQLNPEMGRAMFLQKKLK